MIVLVAAAWKSPVDDPPPDRMRLPAEALTVPVLVRGIPISAALPAAVATTNPLLENELPLPVLCSFDPAPNENVPAFASTASPRKSNVAPAASVAVAAAPLETVTPNNSDPSAMSVLPPSVTWPGVPPNRLASRDSFPPFKLKAPLSVSVLPS